MLTIYHKPKPLVATPPPYIRSHMLPLTPPPHPVYPVPSRTSIQPPITSLVLPFHPPPPERRAAPPVSPISVQRRPPKVPPFISVPLPWVLSPDLLVLVVSVVGLRQQALASLAGLVERLSVPLLLAVGVVVVVKRARPCERMVWV